MERIGEDLRRLHLLEAAQVEHVISLQQQGDKRLFGELAVQLDYIAIDDLLYYLRDAEQGGRVRE